MLAEARHSLNGMFEPFEHATLEPASSEAVAFAKRAYQIHDDWVCLGRLAELRNLETAGLFFGLIEPPCGYRYLLFQSPHHATHILVLSPESHSEAPT